MALVTEHIIPLIIASLIKTNDKIRDQLMTNFGYFSKLMHANIDGHQRWGLYAGHDY